ncbi:hypothetical protein K7X08_007056 [Anisodus acutangulus]|uniref:Uncharacterized protein n=1 Tax=Anisodus acutangulus TaxID=402998 RepID=A0A9Q1QXX4_9SOLA|nr:hypothetical protein K7X08_007056 [Anisodus acutangulus]
MFRCARAFKSFQRSDVRSDANDPQPSYSLQGQSRIHHPSPTRTKGKMCIGKSPENIDCQIYFYLNHVLQLHHQVFCQGKEVVQRLTTTSFDLSNCVRVLQQQEAKAGKQKAIAEPLDYLLEGHHYVFLCT